MARAHAKELGIEIRWEGQGVEDKGYLISSPFKGEAGRGMGQEDKCIVAEMVREDLKSAERDELIKHHGYKAMDYHE
jgi:GDPmannose 4,6-dehydratase